MKRNIAILGSTGSIGTQALDVIRSHREQFNLSLLVANTNIELLAKQIIEFTPKYAVIGKEELLDKLRQLLPETETKLFAGAKAIEDLVAEDEVDIVLTAMVGYSGLKPTISAIKKGKTIALANKETLVVAGEIIMALSRQHEAKIIPVDSEHSAIYQCLVGEEQRFEKIILTASGGPFRTLTKEELQHVTLAQALKHPNWTMGAKVTIDSASLMNKGLEMIEARWLFDCEASEIDVLVHPQSIVHSMVQFADGSIKAQLGTPDMRLPISYALGEVARLSNDYARYDFLSQPLTFERADMERFPNLALAYEAIKLGANAPCALNASNEVAVSAFLREEISFTDISKLNMLALEQYKHIAELSLESLEATDRAVRQLTEANIHTLS